MKHRDVRFWALVWLVSAIVAIIIGGHADFVYTALILSTIWEATSVLMPPDAKKPRPE